MTALAIGLVALPVLCFGYAYAGYPLILWLLASRRPRPARLPDPPSWPLVTVVVPCYNEERSIAAALDRLLAVDYPADRRQILVVSDASTDGTDAVAATYAARGVELLRLPRRSGKTAAENAAFAVARGDIVVNLDATARIAGGALKALVRAFQDPTVGVASSRDVSSGADLEGTGAEQGYVGYEMWVRSLETRLGSIVGASGSFFAVRRDVHDPDFPPELSRDFASAMMAHERGLRAVSVDDALCVVPRTPALANEFRRKQRTMARGLETLWYKRHLLDPFRHGGFAFMLLSHKLCRWLVYLTLPTALLGVLLLAVDWWPARLALGAGALVVALGIVGLRWPAGRSVPPLVSIPGFALAANLAGILAWKRLLFRERAAVWEPTRRAEGGAAVAER